MFMPKIACHLYLIHQYYDIQIATVRIRDPLQCPYTEIYFTLTLSHTKFHWISKIPFIFFTRKENRIDTNT